MLPVLLALLLALLYLVMLFGVAVDAATELGAADNG